MAGQKLLIIDDEPLIAEMITRGARTAGHEAEFVGDADQAIASLNQGAIYNFIICDMQMPGVDGIGFFDWLRNEQPHIYRVMITGLTGMKNDLDEMKSLGIIDEYLLKPFSVSELLELIDNPPEREV